MRVSWGESLSMALGAVWTHRFRSALTVLGIVIGITTVVTVASLLTGLRQGIVMLFQEQGPDNIFIYKTSGDPQESLPSPKEQRRKPIRPEYAEILRRLCPSVEDVSVTLYVPPVFRGRPLTARVPGYETDSLYLTGVSANYFSITPREIAVGRAFTREEEHRGARVALLGADTATVLFPAGDAVGRKLIVDGAEFEVVGVFAKAKGGFFGRNRQDQEIIIPFETARMRYPMLDRILITAKARPGMRQAAYEEVEGILRKIRRTPPGEENDFAISTPDLIVQQLDRMTRLIILATVAISGLGLLVGGIGVMNIMLVSVTERTREIGVRKAIGARRRDIVAQFLLEAVALTGSGGVIGLGLAMLVTLVLGRLLPALPSAVPLWAVAAGLGVSLLVGLFFGVWPAMKAARLDPVVALRYE
ncbi:MAG: ABC transporter permease [Bryobacteraceae bacterium]